MEALIRPADWEWPLLVHVAGAMVLVGSLVAALALAAAARHGGDGDGDGAATLTRLSLRVLLLGALPSFVVMRAGAEWVASKEDLGDPNWIGVGYSASDGGLLLLVIATVVAWRAARRGPSGPGGLSTAVVALAAVLLLVFAVAIWAMTTKPT